MVQKAKSPRGLSSILGNCCSTNCTSFPDCESQVIGPYEHNITRSILRDSVIISDNNNYISSVLEDCDSDDPQLSRWSSNSNWTRKTALIPPHFQRQSASSQRSCVPVLVTIVVTIVLLVSGSFCISKYIQSQGSVRGSVALTPVNFTVVFDDPQDIQVTLPPVPVKNRKANISRLSWLALQKNEARESKEADERIQFSVSKDKVHRIPCGDSPGRTPCCKLNKSTEVLEVAGCLPIEVPRHQCVGGCDHVFLDGNPYVSIPKCQPVRTRKHKFILTCGDDMRQVTKTIEVASRCRCA